MFENIVKQNAVNFIKDDLVKGKFPGAVLLSGNAGSGKLSTALEIARILACRGENKGSWTCRCSSCLQHKALVSNDVLLAGPRDCTPEIAASKSAFLKALNENARYLEATRYLFIRSIRKLTARFSQILWQNDDKISKIAAITSEIDEELELIDFPHNLPEKAEVEKCTENLEKLCKKLESDFLYDSIPIDNIRNASSWARLKAAEGKKTIIIENADRMLESVRNALLKILEEPPQDTVFILTTSRRNSVMPTILSRVRTYNFAERNIESQHEVIDRVFHRPDFNGTIDDFLLDFLPVKSSVLKEAAGSFFREISSGHIPDAQKIVKDCGGFDPRVMLKIFLSGITDCLKKFRFTPAGTEASVKAVEEIRNCYSHITVYNQKPLSALEELIRNLLKINKIYGNVFRCAVL